jgi:3-oxoacyl-[acyl-carrier protein] reductase
MNSKNVLLIGASGGLGNYFSKRLAEEGYNLSLHYHTGKAKIKTLLSEIGKNKKKVNAYKADITNELEVIRMIRNVIHDFGTIDILINNAGLAIDGMSWKLPIESWNKVINVNLTGPFLCTKHTLPYMKKKNWGRIINISSVVPKLGIPGTSAYSASKSGLDGFTKTVSKELIKFNITINQISLGYFNTGMLFQIPENIRNKIKENIPKKEFGDPIEITKCILYLISENSSYITGQNININGGLFFN